jgi:hypothetical protein
MVSAGFRIMMRIGFAVFSLLALCSSQAAAQSMSYSVYTDMWDNGDQSTVVGYSELDDNAGCAGGSPTSTWTSIYSPTRYSEVWGSTASLPFDGEEGNWSVGGTFQLQCNCGPQGFTHSFSVGGSLSWHLSIKRTYYYGPVREGLACYYLDLACSSGSPTCSWGMSIATWPTSLVCPDYSYADWLVAQRGTSATCLFALSSPANGPGPCN